jgi:hypothetical protein
MADNLPDLINDYDSDTDSGMEDGDTNLMQKVDSGATFDPNKSKSKKKRKSFEEDKAEKLNYENVSRYLEEVQKAVFQCCSFLCYTWLTTALVLFCRSQYLLIDNPKGRNQWLENHLREMEDLSKKRLLYAYCIETSEGIKKRCCGKAWDFAYGVNERTKKRASQRRTNNKRHTISMKSAKEKRVEGLTEKEMYLAAWLKRFAQTFGDVLPFGDKDKETEIRVPFGKKKMVHAAYVDCIQSDPTYQGGPCTYPEFVLTWKNRDDLQHIKCAKYKAGFSKCDECDRYSEQTKKQLDPLVRDQLDLELKTHLYGLGAEIPTRKAGVASCFIFAARQCAR